MGTRGFVGFHVSGVLKIAYNHYDSYPSGTGVKVLDWARAVDKAGAWPAVQRAAKALVVIPQGQEQERPPHELIARLGPKYGDPNVGGLMSSTVISSWYQLLRGAQGDPDAMLDAGHLVDASSFALDGLFCEWGYLVNLDGDGSFEVYRGFFKEDHDEGLWGRTGSQRPPEWKPEHAFDPPYWPVKRMATWSLFDLPTDEQLLAIDTEED